MNTHLKPKLSKRVLPNGVEVYYFYKYEEIEDLIKSKYFFIGYFIYKILAQITFKKFSKSFNFDENVYALPADNRFCNGYSNTNILAHSLKSSTIKPLYNYLKPLTSVNYAGKDLSFRLKNPKSFSYEYKPYINTIIVDDTVVTGSTIQSISKELSKNSVNVMFAITLCDARK